MHAITHGELISQGGLYPLDTSVALSTFKELQPQPTAAMPAESMLTTAAVGTNIDVPHTPIVSIPTHPTAAEGTNIDVPHTHLHRAFQRIPTHIPYRGHSSESSWS